MTLVQLLLALSIVSTCHGFGVIAPTYSRPQQLSSSPSSSPWSLFMSADAESSGGESSSTEDVVAEEEEPAAAEEDQEEEEDEEEPEDPEIKALKDEIFNLESELKAKRRTLAGTIDKADEYTKTGYARKVAEMENMRRARSMLQSSNKAGATASTLAEFLPIYDQLDALNEQYSNDEFGKQYNALLSSMKQAYTDLGVTEYSVQVGDLVDKSRMVVVDSLHSEQQPADVVLESLRGGLELQGNIVRYAEVVASLGAQVEEEEEEGADDEDEAAGSDEDDEPEAAASAE